MTQSNFHIGMPLSPGSPDRPNFGLLRKHSEMSNHMMPQLKQEVENLKNDNTSLQQENRAL
tara:strand:+ start:820 stop:1002 length:183 start_codon:yes stop_codon:yes gene_type:complete